MRRPGTGSPGSGHDRPSVQPAGAAPLNAATDISPVPSMLAAAPAQAFGRSGAPLAVRRATVAQLGSALGNRALASRLGPHVRRLAEPAAPDLRPADIQAQEGFNAKDKANTIVRAINQAQVDWLAVPAPDGETILARRRRVDYATCVSVLNGLTASEIDLVDQKYIEFERRPMKTDLLGLGQSGYETNLTELQRAHLGTLLSGTRAGADATPEAQFEARRNKVLAQAAELRGLLAGTLDTARIEQVMTILRQGGSQDPAAANADLVAAARTLAPGFTLHMLRLGPERRRAELLIEGKRVEADAAKVSDVREKIEKVDAEIKKLEAAITPKELTAETFVLTLSNASPVARMQNEMRLNELRSQRKKLVAEIESRAGAVLAEAEASGASHAEAGAAVTAALGGDVAGVAAQVGGPSAHVISGISSGDPGARAAAEINRLAKDGKLTGAALTAVLRKLRSDAEARVTLKLGAYHPQLQEVTDRLAEGYFASVRTAYEAIRGKGKSFDDLVDETGGAVDETVNKSLMAGSGRMDEVQELVLALTGERKDMATVERVLKNKSADQIAQIKVQYMAASGGRSLERDLLGAGKDATSWADIMGKASGTARINIEDYLQRPSKEGGPAEVRYILSRAESEFRYAIDNGGFVGSVRDTFGNEERKLLDSTIRELRSKVLEYRAIVGWRDTETETVLYEADVESAEAKQLIQEMRLLRHTIRGDRKAYEDATDKLRQVLKQVASFVLQAVLTAVLTPAAAALVRLARVGALAHRAATVARLGDAVVRAQKVAKFATGLTASTASNVATTLAITGDYTLGQFKDAIVGGFAGPLGSSAAGRILANPLFGPIAKGLVNHLGPKASAALHGFAKETVSSASEMAATGEDLSLDGLMQNVLLEKLGEGITSATTNVTGIGAPAAGGDRGTTPATGDAGTSGAGEAAPAPATGQAAVPPPGEIAPDTTAAETTASKDEPAAGGGGGGGRDGGRDGGGGGGRDGGGDGGRGDSGSSGRLPPRPLPQMPPPSPVRVPSAITDLATAAEAFRVQARNGNPVRKAIGNREVLLREWRDAKRNNQQYSPEYLDNPPPAWTDHEGNIVIDKSRVDPSSPDGVPRSTAKAESSPSSEGTPAGDASRPARGSLGAAEPGSAAGGAPGTDRTTVWQTADKNSEAEAFRLYKTFIADNPKREAAMIYNHKAKQWAVIQGDATSVSLDSALKQLGWDRESTSAGRHSHPDGVIAGQTAELNQLPSGRGHDLDVVQEDAEKSPRGTQWHTIDIMMDGKPDRTHVMYSDKTGEWTVDYPDRSERGGRGSITFKNADTYHQWFRDRFGVAPRHSGGGAAANMSSADSNAPPPPTGQTADTGQTAATGGTAASEPPSGPGRPPGGRPPGGGAGAGAGGNKPLMVPYEARYATNSSLEAAHLLFDARAGGKFYMSVSDSAMLKRWWNQNLGMPGDPPVAWVDSYGGVVVDANRVPELVAGVRPAEPPPAAGQEVHRPDLDPQANQRADAPSKVDFGPPVSAGEGRSVSQPITDPNQAAGLVRLEDQRGRFVKIIWDPRAVGPAWTGDYNGQGEAPPAWFDERGFLVVDGSRVRVPDYAPPRGGEGGPPGPDGGGSGEGGSADLDALLDQALDAESPAATAEGPVQSMDMTNYEQSQAKAADQLAAMEKDPKAAVKQAIPEGTPLSPDVLRGEYGMPEGNQHGLTSFVNGNNPTGKPLRIVVRPTAKSAPEQLAQGALPKVEDLKAKTANETDRGALGIDAPPGTVAYALPQMPQRPPAMDDARWSALQDRYFQRMAEYWGRGSEMTELQKPVAQQRGTSGQTQVQVLPGGQVVTPQGQAFTGDHDVFQITYPDGTPLSPTDMTQVVRALEAMGVRHPAHVDWVPTKPEDIDVSNAIRLNHWGGKEGAEVLIVFEPGKPPSATYSAAAPLAKKP